MFTAQPIKGYDVNGLIFYIAVTSGRRGLGNMSNERIEERVGHAFSRSLQELRASGVEQSAMLTEFAASELFDQYRAEPDERAGTGISLEEAFYQFLYEHDPLFAEGSAHFYLLTHEFLNALLTRVASEEEPPFVIETWQVRNNGTVRYALQRVAKKKAEFMSGLAFLDADDSTVVWLYAATSGGLISQPISKFVAEVLEFRTPETLRVVQDDLMSKYELTENEFDSQVQELRDLGLIASP